MSPPVTFVIIAEYLWLLKEKDRVGRRVRVPLNHTDEMWWLSLDSESVTWWTQKHWAACFTSLSRVSLRCGCPAGTCAAYLPWPCRLTGQETQACSQKSAAPKQLWIPWECFVVMTVAPHPAPLQNMPMWQEDEVIHSCPMVDVSGPVCCLEQEVQLHTVLKY